MPSSNIVAILLRSFQHPDEALNSSLREIPTTAVIKSGRSWTRYDSASTNFWKTRSNSAQTLDQLLWNVVGLPRCNRVMYSLRERCINIDHSGTGGVASRVAHRSISDRHTNADSSLFM